MQISRLKFERRIKNLSARAVAQQAGVSQPLVSLLENWRYASNVDEKKLRRLAKVLDVKPPEALLEPVDVEQIRAVANHGGGRPKAGKR